MTDHLRQWLTDDNGQDLIEYVLLTATMGLCAVVVMNSLDDIINVVYTGWNTGTQAIWEPASPK